MALTTLTLAWLMLAPATTPSDVVHIDRKGFKIPIHIDPAQRPEIKELLLFCSSDQGKNWLQVAKASLDQDAFSFMAPGDGQYWFKVQVVDNQGNRQPPDLYTTPPSQKIEVDTTKPVFNQFKVERQGTEIVVEWDIKEEHLDWNFFRLEHRSADALDNTGFPVIIGNPSARGQARFAYSGLGGVMVKMEVQDLAGNRAAADRTVGGTAPPARFTEMPPMRPPVPPPTEVANHAASMHQGNFGSGNPPPLDNTFTRASTDQGLPPIANFQSPGGAVVPPPPLVETQPGVLATAGGTSGFTAPPPAASSVAIGGVLPPVTVTNQKKFALEFEVTRQGPSNVGAVELYISADNGQAWQWKLLVDHKDLQNPIPVELPFEGTFGFRMVLRSKAGLSNGPPQSTHPPEVRIEYDATLPFAQLIDAKPLLQKPNVLVLTWTAKDKNLAPNPISLDWSPDQRQGSWKPISPAELSNSERFEWEVTPDVPHRVYLRLMVRDTAGNISQAITREPILVDLIKPEGVLRGIAGTFRP